MAISSCMFTVISCTFFCHRVKTQSIGKMCVSVCACECMRKSDSEHKRRTKTHAPGFRTECNPLITRIHRIVFFSLSVLMALHFRFCFAQTFGVNALQKCTCVFCLVQPKITKLFSKEYTKKKDSKFPTLRRIFIEFNKFLPTTVKRQKMEEKKRVCNAWHLCCILK